MPIGYSGAPRVTGSNQASRTRRLSRSLTTGNNGTPMRMTLYSSEQFNYYASPVVTNTNAWRPVVEIYSTEFATYSGVELGYFNDVGFLRLKHMNNGTVYFGYDVTNGFAFTGDMSVTGNVAISGTLNANGAVQFNSTLNAVGAVIFSNTLNVTGNTTVKSLALDHIHLNTDTTNAAPASPAIGDLWWNDTTSTLNAKLTNNVTMQIGQETMVWVFNNTGGNWVDGQVVMLNGTTGSNIAGTLANANAAATSHGTVGVVTEPLNHGSHGFITVHGVVNGLNTNTWAEGDTLWLSNTTAGSLVNSEPAYPNQRYRIGKVVKKHATQGIIFVRPHLVHYDFSGIEITGPVYVNTINGIDINPGSDTNVDLLTVGVTGAPRLSWYESYDAFYLTHPIEVGYSNNNESLNQSIKFTIPGRTTTVNGSFYRIGCFGTVDSSTFDINTGLVDSGYRIAFLLNGYTPSTIFKGTLGTVAGMRTDVGLYRGTGTINTVYGWLSRIETGVDGGACGNTYHMYGEYATDNAATITNRWGIYLSGETKNYLAGNLGLGIEPTSKLHVNGTSNIVGSALFGNAVNVNTTDGIDVNPGSDASCQLITVGVTGAPTLAWDEPTSTFYFDEALYIYPSQRGEYTMLLVGPNVDAGNTSVSTQFNYMPNKSVDANATNYISGFQTVPSAYTYAINTGIIDSGFRAGLNFNHYTYNTNFKGTLNQQYGVRVETGMYIADANAVINDSWGISVTFDSNAGTITNAYGLYTNFPVMNGTVTNKWGVYCSGDAKNKLDGSLGLGIAPTEKLHVLGNAKIGGNTDYMSIDNTGHIVFAGAAKPWDDLRVEPVVRSTGANIATFEQVADNAALGDTGSTRGIYAYTFDDVSAANEKELHFTMQMPHAWDGGSIYLHVHWFGTVADTTSAPRWGLEYAWKGVGETFGATTTIYTDGTNYTLGGTDANITPGKHYISAFSALAPGNTANSISSVLIGRLFRNSSDAADTYDAATNKCALLYIDAHMQLSTFGSTDEYTK